MQVRFSTFVKRVAAGAALAVVAALPLKAETLTDALIAAYKNSKLLEQNQAVLRAADEDVAQAMAALRPVLTFIANTGLTDSRAGPSTTSASISLNASLDIYDGGDNKLAIDIAKESVLATRAALVGVEQEVLLAAVEAYMDVRSATQSLTLGENNLRLITEQLRAARDRFEVGEVTRTDVSLAESRLAASQSNLVAAQGNLTVARESFKAAVGRYPGSLAAPARLPRLPGSLAEAQAIAQRQQPGLEQARRQVTISELSLLRARAARGPTLTGTMGLGFAEGGAATQNFNLQFSQPVLRGGALYSAERQALAGRDEAIANLHHVSRLVDQQVANAWANLAVSSAQLQASDKQIRAAELAFEGTKEEARLGSRTTLDVLDAEQELLDARTARLEAESTQYVAYYQVLASMGLLTADHLNLGIPTYDPVAYYNLVKDAPAKRSVQGDKLDRVLKSIGRE